MTGRIREVLISGLEPPSLIDQLSLSIILWRAIDAVPELYLECPPSK